METNAEKDTWLSSFHDQYVGLLTAITSQKTPTVTEASWSGYARQQVPMGSPGNTTPSGGRQVASSAAQTFPANGSGSAVDVLGWGIYSAETGGSPRVVGFMGSKPPLWAVGTPTSEDIYCKGHTFAANQLVRFLAAAGAELPAGLSEDTDYHVIAAGLATDLFRVSTTQGGSAVNITAQGAMLVIPRTTLVVPDAAQVVLASGAVIVSR